MSIFTEFATLDSTGAGDGERIALRDLEGSVVVMVPLEYIPVVETANGPSDCVRVDIHDISGKRTYRDQLVFARMLVNGLKTKVTPEGVDDIPVLGVVGKGAAKAGKSSPWILTSATEAQSVAASEYMDAL